MSTQNTVFVPLAERINTALEKIKSETDDEQDKEIIDFYSHVTVKTALFGLFLLKYSNLTCPEVVDIFGKHGFK